MDIIKKVFIGMWQVCINTLFFFLSKGIGQKLMNHCLCLKHCSGLDSLGRLSENF